MHDRKKDHIDLAFQSKVESKNADARFFYEPLLAAHPSSTMEPFGFAGNTMQLPIWVSSMTGGTALAGTINRNLAQACNEFGMGMGLGSCRVLLDSDEYLDDFNVRSIIGNNRPLYANLGICQLEKLLLSNSLHKVTELVEKLQANGIIIHINPLQEAFQPEGDKLQHAPIDLVEWLIKETKLKIIVKEVGQGMGPKSLERLLSLPIEAIEFGALGGTNFALLEMLRQDEGYADVMRPFANVGHTAEEMLGFVKQITEQEHLKVQCKQLIISGGISSVLTGYQLVKQSPLPSVFGMGAMFLKHATGSYKDLQHYVEQLQSGWLLANSYLHVK